MAHPFLPEDIYLIEDPRVKWPASANIYLIEDQEGLIMIDTGCGGEECLPQLLMSMEKEGAALDRVHTIILTHAHPDHMGSLSAIQKVIDPQVWIHPLEKPQVYDPSLLTQTFNIPLVKERLSALGNKMTQLELLDFFVDSGCAMCSASVTGVIAEGEQVELGAYRFQVLHTPGHSPGHVSLYEKERGILLAGDLLGEMVAWYSPGGGGVTGYWESLKKLEGRPVELLLPSHGRPTTEVEAAVELVAGTLERRDAQILKAVESRESVEFLDLLPLLFEGRSIYYFSNVVILESHLQKLEAEGKIYRQGGGSALKSSHL